jgi:hypothetical protein
MGRLNIPPPPTWAKTDNPAWLDWFTTVANLTSDNTNTLEAGAAAYGFALDATETTVVPGSPVDVCSITFTTSGGPVLIFFSAYHYLYTGGHEIITYSLVRDSTTLNYVIASNTVAGSYGSGSVIYCEVPAAGTYTYKVNLSAITGMKVYNKALLLLELKLV